MQDRRALRLCYNCDEKFIAGHKCVTSRFLLLLVEEENNTTDTETSPIDDGDLVEVDNPKIYFQTFDLVPHISHTLIKAFIQTTQD